MSDVLTKELLEKLRSAIAEGETISTLGNGAPNVIVAITERGVSVETNRSRRAGTGPKLVPAWMIQTAWDELERRGSLTAAKLVGELNVKRSAAVCALLACLPEMRVRSSRPIELELDRGLNAPSSAEQPALAPPESKHVEMMSRIGLVGCVKSKVAHAARAADLYVSPLFRGRRAFVERSCDRWFILSAKFGLLEPDRIIEPYEMTLTSVSIHERRVWAERVLAALDCELGSLDARECEIHAGAAYRDHGLVEGLHGRGATVEVPTAHLTQGEQLAFYAKATASAELDPSTATLDIDCLVSQLLDPDNCEPAASFPRDSKRADVPGLYAWWADDGGLTDLAAPFGVPLQPLIYAGQAGATTRLARAERVATLRSRISGNHLNGNIGSSTFRRTLAAVLFQPLALRLERVGTLDRDSNARLSGWMREHLSITIAPCPDRGTLGALEGEILDRLDPPLNLMGMAPNPVRSRLTVLRGALS